MEITTATTEMTTAEFAAFLESQGMSSEYYMTLEFIYVGSVFFIDGTRYEVKGFSEAVSKYLF